MALWWSHQMLKWFLEVFSPCFWHISHIKINKHYKLITARYILFQQLHSVGTSSTHILSHAFCYKKTGSTDLLSTSMSSSWVFVQPAWKRYQKKHDFLSFHFDMPVFWLPTFSIGSHQEKNCCSRRYGAHIAFSLQQRHMIEFLLYQ